MRILNLLAMTVLFFAATVLATMYFREGSNPDRIELAPGAIELGNVRPESIVREVTIVNRLSTGVRLKKVLYACGCTSVRFNKTLLQPNESAIGLISLDLRDRRGEFATSFQVLCSDEHDENIVMSSAPCKINGFVDTYTWMKPEQLQIGQTGVFRFELSSKDSLARIKSVGTDSSAMKLEVVDEGKGFMVNFDAAKWRGPPGKVVVRVETTSDDGIIFVPIVFVPTQ